MIVRSRPSVLRLFFIMRGSIIPDIIGQILLVCAISCAVVAAHRYAPNSVPIFDGAPYALIGIALSVFLGFRNNACYDRWWEARKQWGEMIVQARNMTRQTLVLTDADDAARKRVLGLVIAFTWQFAESLRPGASKSAELEKWLTAADRQTVASSASKPEAITRLIAAEFAALRRSGAISDIVFQMLDQTLGRMAGVQAACERIANTPVPFAYTLLLHRTAYMFCFLLPFGFADTLGWATPIATGLVAYTFFGLDSLSEHLEMPFLDIPNGLALSAMAETLEINLRESMGETNLPPLPIARGYVLM
jgi:putative membrane protein